MNRFLTAAALSVVLLAGVSNIASAQTAPNALVAQQAGTPLTVAAAKRQVNEWLAATGHSALRATEAERDSQGNVKVTVVNPSGVPYTHVLVHAADGTITDARAGAVSNKG
jgi:hypothetical protein